MKPIKMCPYRIVSDICRVNEEKEKSEKVIKITYTQEILIVVIPDLLVRNAFIYPFFFQTFFNIHVTYINSDSKKIYH